ncbi:MAG: GNAT family N-acetyltransferase [Xanthomonadales bacterium]|nr:GNAT family N-acetyltransferase [Xanthomonadales bacterium]
MRHEWTDTLSDGTRVRIRPITSDDLDAERTFLGRLSAESLRGRFLGGVNHLSEKDLQRLCDIDHEHEMAFVAMGGNGADSEVGASRYAVDGESDQAEIAVVVADDWQHKGLGSLLLMHLLDYAKLHAINELHSLEFADNEAMRRLARDFGFREAPDPDNPELVRYTLNLART